MRLFWHISLILTSFGIFLFAYSQAAEDDNSCISCHSKLEEKSRLNHSFHDWIISIHAKAKVECQECHGGDRFGKDKKSAHAGIFPGNDSRSSVSPARLPSTCGNCHEQEFRAFVQSKHYRKLLMTGNGPNCATCHGTMAVRILSPEIVENTCNLCHKTPTQAAEALTLFSQASSGLEKLEKVLNEAKTLDLDVSQEEEQYEKALDLYGKMVIDWHTFKIKDIMNMAHDVTWSTAEAITRLRQLLDQKKLK